MANDNDPFRVFIFKEGSRIKAAASEPESELVVVVDSSPNIHRVFLSSPTAYVTIRLFKCIQLFPYTNRN